MELFRLDVLDHFDVIHWFSDGGGKHFKCTYTMALFAALNNPYPSPSLSSSSFQPSDLIDADILHKLKLNPKHIPYYFHASYHGHSLCDGFFSHLNSLVSKTYNQSAWHLNNTPQPHTSQHFNPIHNARDLAQLMGDHWGKCAVRSVVLDIIPRAPQLKPNVRTLDGIMSWHHITFPSSSSVSAAHTPDTKHTTYHIKSLSEQVIHTRNTHKQNVEQAKSVLKKQGRVPLVPLFSPSPPPPLPPLPVSFVVRSPSPGLFVVSQLPAPSPSLSHPP